MSDAGHWQKAPVLFAISREQGLATRVRAVRARILNGRVDARNVLEFGTGERTTTLVSEAMALK
jgi:hypothetical protein